MRRAAKGKPAAPKIPKRLTNSELAIMFTEYSEREWERMPHVSESDSKWTWGTDLTEADVRGIVRAADNEFQIPHSDYDISLPMGRMGGVSSTAQDITSDSSMPQPAISQPPISELSSDDVPIHFTKYPLRRQRSAVPEGFPPAAEAIHPHAAPVSSTADPLPHTAAGAAQCRRQSSVGDLDLLDLATAATQPSAARLSSTDVLDLLNLAAAAIGPNTTVATHCGPNPSLHGDEFSEMLEMANMSLGIPLSTFQNTDMASSGGTIGMPAIPSRDGGDGIESDILALANFALQWDAGSPSNVESDMLALADLALLPDCPPAASHPPADPSTESHITEGEILELAALALTSLPTSAEPPAGDGQDADADADADTDTDTDTNHETSDEEGLEYIDEHDPPVASVIPGPWTASHFPRAPSDTQSESDDEESTRVPYT